LPGALPLGRLACFPVTHAAVRAAILDQPPARASQAITRGGGHPSPPPPALLWRHPPW
jgi:hypothetical protein